ncbi:MAG: IS1 family transposase [Thermoguttaceae bacterium]
MDFAFGPYVKYGQCIKDYRSNNMEHNYVPPEVIDIERKPISGMRENETDTICTSHVERHNLTIRTLMKRFTRLSLGFSKKLENLEAACAVFLAFYNFVWRTRDANNGRTRLSAAMAAGVIDELWDFERLYDEVMGTEENKVAA